MSDVLVSVRMPKTLMHKLKEKVQENDYLDLSEQMRSIIRTHAVKYLDPHTGSMQQLRGVLEEDIKQKNTALKKEEILRELKKLLEGDQ